MSLASSTTHLLENTSVNGSVGETATVMVVGPLSGPTTGRMVATRRIVESLRAGHQTDSLPESGAQYKIEVAILKDRVSLTIDTTGPSLHKRGYRKLTARAPIKETLAAAMVQLSYWRRDRPLIDTFAAGRAGTATDPQAVIDDRNSL